MRMNFLWIVYCMDFGFNIYSKDPYRLITYIHWILHDIWRMDPNRSQSIYAIICENCKWIYYTPLIRNIIATYIDKYTNINIPISYIYMLWKLLPVCDPHVFANHHYECPYFCRQSSECRFPYLSVLVSCGHCAGHTSYRVPGDNWSFFRATNH